MRTGRADLPLHTGRAPRWLFERMRRLAREIVCVLVSDYDANEVLRRLSDPFWFQAFGCVLGFDWHSSGVTTTTCGALKDGLRGLEGDVGLWVAGGKGAVSRKTPAEIAGHCASMGLDPAPLIYASRMSAKVDSAALQDGYQVYHHAFFFTRDGRWAVVQQGMNDATGLARRYHWLSDEVADFVREPHHAVCSQATGRALNMVAEESGPARTASAEAARETPLKTFRQVERVLLLPRRHDIRPADINTKYLHKIFLKTHDRQPADFERLLGIEGVGPKTVRALALISELVYGAPPSFRDPARYAFAHGGKDGHPFPVDRRTYDQSIEILASGLQKTHVEHSEKVKAFKRLDLFRFGREGQTSG